ncbi:MAG: hypothetical protein A3K18_30250 [Lentisphaerae bacterium RIFOXYA12_64_32]|nr:MAG: hypothetical protein A3K18_30250 [Lentisphaerae bacterium RIFOXYA12_64_32]
MKLSSLGLWRARLFGGLVVFAAGCCPQKKQESANSTGPLPSVPVCVQTAVLEVRATSDEVVGTVRPKLTAKISAQISGPLIDVPVSTGQEVKKGDLLARIDAKEIETQRDQAKAVLEQAEAELDRLTKLLGNRVVAQQEVDNVQMRQRVAKAKLAEVETMIGYAAITAPFDGVISGKFADQGDLAAPGRVLFELDDPRDMRMEAFVPEATAGSVKSGATYEVRIDVIGNPLQAVVSEISPTADSSSRTFLVKFDLPPTPGLHAGQFGRVRIPVATTSVLVVPAVAVLLRGQMETVFVVEADNLAHLRLVKTGKREGDKVEILSGVTEKERVVSEGAGGLTDGQPVAVKE